MPSCLLITLLFWVVVVHGFGSSKLRVLQPSLYQPARSLSIAYAKKKRKRKKSRGGSSAVSIPSPASQNQESEEITELELRGVEETGENSADNQAFQFAPDDAISMVVKDDEVMDDDGNPFQLPDIKDALKKKEIAEEIARIAEEERQMTPKIKRSDSQAFTKLLESRPFADADDSYFEDEEYGLVSALLGEGAKPFLGVPIGPIQVGHFIGALGIVLMAYVDYPGFPLTNLPSPVRGCFQGGLAAVYAINAILAILAAFKAIERGQPVPLWITKTFAVGGLAYDQLTQLPTLEEISSKRRQ